MTHAISIDTDVLVIGGGVAGARAAYDADRAGLSVTMVVKGLLGKSGCSIFAGNLNYFAPPDDESGAPPPATTADEKELRIRRTMAFLAKYTHYLGDQEYMRRASEWNQREFYDWIESRGVYILRDDDGNIVTDLPRKTQIWAVQMGMSGTVVMDMLRKLIFDTDVRVLEQTTATRLMTRDGEVVGATALDFANGRLFSIRAKAVVLATGHSNYMSLRSTGTRDGSASGWVMAYEAGAKIQNIEMQWHHASDVAYPATWMRLHLYPNPLPGTERRGQLFNTNGEMFFDSNWLPENPVPYIMQLKHLVKEVDAGRARLDGGYFTNYRHVERGSLEDYVYQTQFAKKVGIDLGKEMYENAVTWHMNVGGVRVNGSTMESDVPGLLAAGSVAALVTGGLPNSMFEGLTAAETAIRRVESMPRLHEPDAAQLGAEERRVFALLRTEPGQGLLPGQVKKRIRRAMWEHMNYIKTEASMLAAQAELDRIEAEDLPRMRMNTDTRNFNYDWVDALDAVDMLKALQMQIGFSLHRKESRGCFYRRDYPVTDNRNWLKHLVGHRDTSGSLALELLPVDLPYAVPEEEVASFFDVDY